MSQLKRTVFYDRHLSAGARLVEFGGWEMPVQYAGGIVSEHLVTRKHAGLFDVSHMGRFRVAGRDALAFCQHALTNDAASLKLGMSQYTMIPNDSGGAVDDAYLYRFSADAYLLVVNASNLDKDWQHLMALAANYDVTLVNTSDDLAMLALQGPTSQEILQGLLSEGQLPEARRNALSTVQLQGIPVQAGRTGYTGEPVCFELFVDVGNALAIWDMLIGAGASPVGLGARDSLRLEAALPLYGHELGTDSAGNEIPIFACPLARYAVSLDECKGQFVGRKVLELQRRALEEFADGDFSHLSQLPRQIRPIALLDRGVARAGSEVICDGKVVGEITSGTMVPGWEFENDRPTDAHSLRALCLAYIDSRIPFGQDLTVQVRGKELAARVVKRHLNPLKPPFARPVLP